MADNNLSIIERIVMDLAADRTPSKEDVAKIGKEAYEELASDIEEMKKSGAVISIPN